uniref:Protein regulator of cytokinesis 1 n=1 Tax=Trichobilharzia regenti TaxID=157069 RepID=A0AA85KIX5_TRIRE|nr:unnamed protein product [Trichobilharzia regenti]
MSSYPWVAKILDQITLKITSISDIWKEMGIEGENLNLRVDALTSYLLSMLEEMYNEEILAKQSIVESIKKLKIRIKEIESEMGLTSCFPDCSSLVMTEKLLYDHFKSLSEKSTAILQRYNSLKEDERALCARLGEPEVPVTFIHVPNSEHLEILKANIDHLTLEKRSRCLRLSKLIQEITNLKTVLQWEVSKEDEIMVAIMAPNAMENLSLSTDFLDRVARLRSCLAQELVQLDGECQALTKQILDLERRLNVDPTDTVDVKQEVSASFFRHLKRELERLKQLRLKNLTSFISKCQTELVVWWENCFVGEDDRDPRLTSGNEDLNESLLTSLESEIDRWKAFYLENETLFKAIESWQCILSRLRLSERKMKDPSVLKNRGGILLVIDKEIKQLRRELSRQYSVLRELSLNNNKVKIHGLPVLDYLRHIEQQCDNAERENQFISQNSSRRELSACDAKVKTGSKRALDTSRSKLRTPTDCKKPCTGLSNSRVATRERKRTDSSTCQLANVTSSSLISLSRIGSSESLSSLRTPRARVQPLFKTPISCKTPSSISSMSSSQKKIVSSTPKTSSSGQLGEKKMCSTPRVLKVQNSLSANVSRFASPLSATSRSAVNKQTNQQKSSRTINNNASITQRSQIKPSGIRK